jgi:hypothetical protein
MSFLFILSGLRLVPRCVNWRMMHALRAHDEEAETTYADFRNEVLSGSDQ